MLLLAPVRLVMRAVRRFHHEQCAQTVAALSFATLIGLVPMIAAGFAFVSLLPESVGLGAALEKFMLANLLPDKAGVVIGKYISQFAVRTGRVTILGALVLGVTALLQMFTIERAFNRIWRVRTDRPLLRRLAMHAIALLFAPLVFGATLAGMTFVAGVSFGVFDEPAWVRTFVNRSLVPFVFMSGLFGLLYWAVPNKPVRRWHAGFGGAMAAFGFVGLQKLFALYLTAGLNMNTVVYGAFSAIPVFLVWLYASWSVILFGALMVAELPRSATPG